jgi:membrane protease YdiL (CAAX protease family)
LRQFADRHPYWFVAVLELVIVFIYLVAGAVAQFAHLPNLALYGMAQVGLTLAAVALLSVLGWWRVVGFRKPDDWSDLRYFVVPLLPLAINLVPGVEVTSVRHLGVVLALTLAVGFVEEVFFRGLMLNALKGRGLWRAATITSLLFGVTHAMNVLAGTSAFDAVAQIFYATAIGFAYAALVLKKGILWPLVIAHFLIDFANFIQRPGFTFPPGWTLAITLATGFIFTAYGVFVILRVPEAGVGDVVSPSYERVERWSR